MTAIASGSDGLRLEAARLAGALLRFEEQAAHLSPTTTRGVVAVTMRHELSGERRQGAEKTLSNVAAGLDELAPKLGLTQTSRVLVEFDQESHGFSFGAVREWTQRFPVQVSWNVRPPLELDR